MPYQVHQARLVAAMTMTGPPIGLKTIHFSQAADLMFVHVHHARRQYRCPRWRPTASISSMNIMHGACCARLCKKITHP